MPTKKERRRAKPAPTRPGSGAAAKHEATDTDTTTVTWRDRTFEIAASADDWEVDVIEAFENGKAATALRGVLGAQQWQAFKDATPRPRVKDMTALVNQVAKKLGFADVGE